MVDRWTQAGGSYKTRNRASSIDMDIDTMTSAAWPRVLREQHAIDEVRKETQEKD